MLAQQGLYDFLQILNSPEMYPDIAGAGFLMSPILSFASSIVAYLGIAALVFVLLRIGADVVLMAGLGSIISNTKDTGAIGRAKGGFFSFSSFKNGGELPPDAASYLSKYAVKHLIMIAFIGLMISGQLFPLAGTLTATSGAVIAKIANINPVPYVEALDISPDAIGAAFTKSSAKNLMEGHTRYTSYMTAALQRLSSTEEISNDEYKKIAISYWNAYWAAEQYSVEIKAQLEVLKGKVDAGNTKLSDDEQTLREYDYNSHNKNVDNLLLQNGKDYSTIKEGTVAKKPAN